MNRLVEAWAQGVVRYRAAILLFTALILILSPLSYDRLYHDDSNESYFLEHDPNLTAFNHLLERFGDSEYLLVGIPSKPGDKDIFTPQTIQIIDELTQFFENHRHVTQVRSLSKYQYTHDVDGILATDDLFEDIAELQETPEVMAQARTIMAGEPLALGSLLTDDFQNTQIAARTTYIAGENRHKVEVVTELLEFIKAQGYSELGYTLHLSGTPVIGERFETLTQRDMAWINPVMGVVMIIILLAIFRSGFATIIPLLLIGSIILITIAAQGWLKWPFTAVNSALTPTIIILAIGASIHVLIEFFHFRKQGLAPKEAASTTIRDLLFPIFFTCLTTAIGFFTLSITELTPVRQFALLAAGASMLIFLLSTTSLPALLSYVPWIAKGNTPRHSGKHNLLTAILTAVPTVTQRRNKAIALVGLAITVFSLYSISFITVDTNIVNYFKKNSWINQDLHYFNETFKGISNLEVIIDTEKADGVKDPAILTRIETLQDYLEAQPEMGKALSLIRFYKQINQALNEDNADYFTLPTTPAMAGQLLLMYENTSPEEDLSDLKSFDGRYFRLSIPVINMNSKAMTAHLHSWQTYIQQHFSDLKLELTGGIVMNNAQNNYVNNGMFQSFGIAILVIGLCFIVLFRSFKYGLIALIPSIVPVILTGGLISLAGISLDLGTMIVGAMTIGIAVDDSIHLMSRYLQRRRRGDPVFDAIRSAMTTSGKAVILTSIILVSGFSVMLMGSFISYIYVGLFSAMIMVFALIGDLLFMPALLFLFDRNSELAAPEQASRVEVSKQPTKEMSHA